MLKYAMSHTFVNNDMQSKLFSLLHIHHTQTFECVIYMYIGILSPIYYYYNNMHVKYSLEIVTFFCEIHGKVLSTTTVVHRFIFSNNIQKMQRVVHTYIRKCIVKYFKYFLCSVHIHSSKANTHISLYGQSNVK